MTKEEDICKEVVAVLQKIGGFIKLSSVATDGASSMTGKTLGLVGLLQKHGIKCPFIYCIIHQESLCVNQLKWKDAMKMVAKIMNAVSVILLLLQAEVEETLKRIQSHKGVIGTIVLNAEGIPIRTSLDNSTTVQYAGLLHQLTMKAKGTVRDIDPQNDLTFLRIRSKKHEIMVAPDKEYLLIVIQNPCE
ncbi:dynein light chain roadblock-type 2 [Podarcis muralis]